MKDFWIYYGLICLGILISFFLPVIKQFIITPGKGKSREQYRGEIWLKIRPYVMTVVFSLLVGLLVFAFIDDLPDWKAALIAGYAWDSTLQKLRN